MDAYRETMLKINGGYRGLSLYEITVKANYELICKKQISREDRDYITAKLIRGVSTPDEAEKFRRGVRAPDGKTDKRVALPLFYIPPYNSGKKYPLITLMMPRTQILSANAYELEILRLLCKLAGDDGFVKKMLLKTKERLKTERFRSCCSAGECFETSMVVLRFLSAAFPSETEWMKKLIAVIRDHISLSGEKLHAGALFYYWLTLSELPVSLAGAELEQISKSLKSGSISFPYRFNPKRMAGRGNEHSSYLVNLYRSILYSCMSRLEGFWFDIPDIISPQPEITAESGPFPAASAILSA